MSAFTHVSLKSSIPWTDAHKRPAHTLTPWLTECLTVWLDFWGHQDEGKYGVCTQMARGRQVERISMKRCAMLQGAQMWGPSYIPYGLVKSSKKRMCWKVRMLRVVPFPQIDLSKASLLTLWVSSLQAWFLILLGFAVTLWEIQECLLPLLRSWQE